MVDFRTDNPLAVLTAAVSGGFWTGATRADAFDLGSTTGCLCRLKNSGTDGSSASDWETHDGSESDPPTVSISSPVNGAALTSSSVSVSGTASDPGVGASGVKEVWVRVDSGTAVKATVLPAGPQVLPVWLMVRVPFTLGSVDNSGNYSTTNSVAVTVTLPPDTTDPTVSITSPTSGASVSAGSLGGQWNSE